MPDWVTHEQAADILGCHVSNVPKLIRKGRLTSRGRGPLPSLSRDQVEDLAEQRRLARENFIPKPKPRRPPVDRRPDQVHEWLSVPEAAHLLGVTRPAVAARIRRERLPATQHGGRYWIRADHLELVERARLASRTRRP